MTQVHFLDVFQHILESVDARMAPVGSITASHILLKLEASLFNCE